MATSRIKPTLSKHQAGKTDIRLTLANIWYMSLHSSNTYPQYIFTFCLIIY